MWYPKMFVWYKETVIVCSCGIVRVIVVRVIAELSKNVRVIVVRAL